MGAAVGLNRGEVEVYDLLRLVLRDQAEKGEDSGLAG